MPICRVEVAGFPDFIRKDNDGKIITETKERDGKQVKVASIYNSVFIYTLCNDEGECIKSDASLIKRGENLYNNSKRIVDYVEYDTKRKAAKAAKEAAKAAEEKKSNPLLEGEIVDDDEL